MSKALIYTANTAGAAVALGNTVPIGSIIRRYGKCIDATGSTINLSEPGYYAVDISATVTAAAAGNLILTLRQDGVAVVGATAEETITTPATQFVSMSISTMIRVKCCGNANLDILTGGTAAPTVQNMTVRAVKVV